jgi:mRNA interferase RelE/StbE
MLRIDLHKPAARFLDRLPPKPRRQLSVKIHQLAADPHPPDSKPLKGFDYPYLRATAGEYRIIYGVEGDRLHVFIVGKRNDDEVYRQLRRGS